MNFGDFINTLTFVTIATVLSTGCHTQIINKSSPHPISLTISQSLLEDLNNDPTNKLSLLVNHLTENLNNDLEKVKAIHDWIALNIDYDINASLRLQKINDNIDYIIKNKVATCSGYAALFKYMCQLANIKCETIHGYILPSNFSQNGDFETLTIPNHQWSAVFLDGIWQLIDVTWGAGYINNNVFTKRYSADYFLLPPGKFIKSHYPKEEFWQLLSEPIKWSQFLANNAK